MMSRGRLFSAIIGIMFMVIAPAYSEDLILSGNDVMTIENTTYTQTGNIIIKDNAKLTIKNTTLIVNIMYHEEFDITVSNNATLEIINSTVKTTIANEIQRIILGGSSNLTFQGSNLSGGLAYFSFGAEGGEQFSGKATLSNSHIQNISILFTPTSAGTISVSDSICNALSLRFNNNFRGEFSNLKPGLFTSWTYTQNNYDISFQNTRIGNFVAACDGPSQVIMRNCALHQFAPTSPSTAVQMTAIDSTINQIPLHGLSNIKAKLWGLKSGHYDNWRLSDHSTITMGELPLITLQNTDVKDWWLVSVFGGSEITIDDSRIELRLYGNSSYTKITNSMIVYRFMLYGATNSTVEFDKTSIENLEVYVPPIAVAIKGNVTFPSGAKILNWYGPSTIMRTYSVLGEVSSATVALYDKKGILVWSGQTDLQGKASFDIEFNDNNYSDNWNLVIVYGNKNRNININLLTSTPILIARAYSISDAILILQMLSGISPIQTINCLVDINDDGKIGLSEMIHILQKVTEIR